ncbi:MAG: protoporphyrinogen oxidase [Thermomicrobiales bacterium]
MSDDSRRRIGQRIAVIGGGISGLAAAHRLITRDPGCSVVLFEASSRLGGKIRTEYTDGFLVEGGPDAFIANKPRGVGLSEELGLADRFITPNQRNRGSFALRRGRLYPLPEGLTGLIPTKLRPMMESKLISPVGKARMGLDFVLPARRDDADESLGAFLNRRLGNEAVRNLIEPLMAGIYAGDASQLSLEATFPQLRKAEREHGGLIRGVIAARRSAERQQNLAASQASRTGFLSFQHGMSTLIDALAIRLREAGAEIRVESSVRSIRKREDGVHGYSVEIEQSGQRSHVDVDQIVLATPAWGASPLMTPLDADAGAALGEIPHVSTSLVALAFSANELPNPDTLYGFGYLVPRTEQREIMAMTWLSSKWEGRVPDGQVLVRAFAGRAGQEHVFAKDDASLVDAVVNELREVLGIHATPTLERVYRWERGMPQYTLGHLARMRRIEAGVQRLQGFALAGNMFRGVGIPDCIASGEAAADRLLAERKSGLAGASTSDSELVVTP